jgi:hypothetical protein
LLQLLAHPKEDKVSAHNLHHGKYPKGNKSSKMSLESTEKGEPIKFIAGTHKGAKGWFNKSKTSKDKSRVYVIVAKQQQDGSIEEKLSHVKISSISTMGGGPGSRIRDVITGQSEVEDTLNKLCILLVKCGVVLIPGDEDQDLEDFTEILLEKMDLHGGIQQAMGSKAEYRIVTYSNNYKKKENKKKEKKADQKKPDQKKGSRKSSKRSFRSNNDMDMDSNETESNPSAVSAATR